MKRVAELDGIRGAAALAVVLYHFIPRYVGAGWAAVDCFFVLSGYLITAILLANRDDPHYFRNFYMRRSLRIWPIYYLGLTVVLVAYRYVPHDYPITATTIAQYYTYTQSVQDIWFAPGYHRISAYNHTWTLAIEEQFYLIWPLVVWLIPRRRLPWVCVAVAISSYALRRWDMTFIVLPAHADGFALGGLLALAITARPIDGRRKALLLSSLLSASVLAAAVLVAGLKGPPAVRDLLGAEGSPRFGAVDQMTWGFLALNVLFTAAVGVAVLYRGSRRLSVLRSAPLVYLGTISYGLYLYHVPIHAGMGVAFRKLGDGAALGASRPFLVFAAEMSLSLGLATASWFWLEKPILALKDRFDYRVEPTRAVEG